MFLGVVVYAQDNKLSVIHIGGSVVGSKPMYVSTLGIIYGRHLLEEEFKADGIKIEWSGFRGQGPAIDEAFAKGALDLASYGDFPSIIARAGGIQTKLIAATYRKTNIYIGVRIDSDIRDIKDLKGKKVSVAKGTNAHLAFNRILEAHGLTEKDVQLLNLTGADADAALGAKQIDVEVGNLNILKLRDLGIARVLYSTKQLPDKEKMCGGLIVSTAFANEYPQILQRILRVYVRAALWTSDEKNREEAIRIWTSTGTSLAHFKEDREDVPLEDMVDPLVDEFFVSHYQEAMNFSIERGFIRRTFDLSTWIDLTFLDQALKTEGLQGRWSEYDVDGKERPKT
jgi:sulfonate transport system substrate-binding protein